MSVSNDGTSIVDIVDDEPAICESLSAAVSRIGFEPRVFHSAEAYLASDSAIRPDCLLLDYSLPKSDGLALLERLGSRGAGVPVIAISGKVDIGAAVRFLELGAVTLLEKPFSVDRLQELLRTTIEAGRRRRATRKELKDLANQIERLSGRERSIIDAIADGKLNREIARELGVSVRTIESDRSRLVQKLDSKTTGEAIARYSKYRTLSAIERQGHHLNGVDLQ